MTNQTPIKISAIALKPIAADMIGIASIPPPIVVPATISVLPKNLFFNVNMVYNLSFY